MNTRLNGSAKLEIGSAAWHIARCDEGNCDRERLPTGKILTKVLDACCRRNCPYLESKIEQKELDEAILTHTLSDTCERNTRRL